jgi:hypothetical protein
MRDHRLQPLRLGGILVIIGIIVAIVWSLCDRLAAVASMDVK